MSAAIDYDFFEKPATARVVDFTEAWRAHHWRDAEGKMHEEIMDDRGRTQLGDNLQTPIKGAPREGVVMTEGQMRRRRRRALRQGKKLTDEMFEQIKPLDEWDAEELARGRPRNTEGNFRGRPPTYITRELHERAMEKFKSQIRNDMNAHTLTAVRTVQMIMESNEVDDKGKPIVPAGTKLDAAKFLIEHLVGKPIQETKSDISVKLQGILGAVMVNPTEFAGQELSGYQPAHVGTRGMAEIEGEILDEDDLEEDSE